MMTVSKEWCTTPTVCNTCGKKVQLVFECEVIKMEGELSVKLPQDVVCKDCGSTDIDFPDFKTNYQ